MKVTGMHTPGRVIPGAQVKTEFMQMWDGMESSRGHRIVVMGATNRPWMVRGGGETGGRQEGGEEEGGEGDRRKRKSSGGHRIVVMGATNRPWMVSNRGEGSWG